MGQNLEGEETSDDTFEENEITHVETSSRFRHLDVFSLLKLNNQILEMRKSIRSGCLSDYAGIFSKWSSKMQVGMVTRISSVSTWDENRNFLRFSIATAKHVTKIEAF